MMTDERHELGARGEALAEQFLKRAGLKLVARSYRTPVGELDRIMRDGETVVFVEVKTRRDRVYADPEDAVTLEKQRHLVRAARWYLHKRGWEERPARFDVVAVILPADGEAEITHHVEAFWPRS
jgi:putative endonuclease